MFHRKKRIEVTTEFLLENRVAELLEENRSLSKIAEASHHLYQALLVDDEKGERLVSLNCDDEFMTNLIRHRICDLREALYGVSNTQVFKMGGVIH